MRPPKRDIKIQVWVRPEEREAWQQRAWATGESLSDWLRGLANGAAAGAVVHLPVGSHVAGMVFDDVETEEVVESTDAAARLSNKEGGA